MAASVMLAASFALHAATAAAGGSSTDPFQQILAIETAARADMDALVATVGPDLDAAQTKPDAEDIRNAAKDEVDSITKAARDDFDAVVDAWPVEGGEMGVAGWSSTSEGYFPRPEGGVDPPEAETGWGGRCTLVDGGGGGSLLPPPRPR